MNVRIAALVAVALGSGTFNFAAAAEGRKPNIVLILADDYGTPGVGCYGGLDVTPNLDALAADGLRFTHAYSMPLCAPTRGVLMSGRYPFRNGVRDNGAGGSYKPSDSPSIAKTLKSAGYATAVAGKWRQLSYFETREDAAAWGFDEFMIWGVGVDKVKGERYWDPAYNHNGSPVEAGDKYGPDLLHDFVVDFMKRHREEPFFVYYPTPLIHSPILRTPDTKGDKSGTLYRDNVAYLDKSVGKLTAALDELGLRENTLLLFVGDNGSVGNSNKVHDKVVDGGKGSMLEGGSNVPFIAHWKGVTPKGKVIDDPVDVSDVYATLAEVAAAKLPDGVKFDGRSLAPQLHGEKGNPRSWAFVQLGSNWFVRSRDWKLDRVGKLFSMKNAPHEQIQVTDAADPAAKAARAELQAALDELNPVDGKAGNQAGGAKVKKKLKKKAASSATK